MEREYLLNCRSYLKNEHYNDRKLLVLQKKLQLKYNTKLLKTDITKNITLIYKSRHKCKRMAEILNIEYRT